MSPEGIIHCTKCSYEIDKADLPDFSMGKKSFKYPKDKEIDPKLAEKLIDHHIESGKNELNGHKDFEVIINGEENIYIEARSYYVEYYKIEPTKP